MTYDSDPTRWTQAPSAAPDLLRDAFAAGRREGPDDAQMHTLALRLAALSGGAAVASVGASSAHASATVGGAAVASGGASLTKIALSIALLGAAATGVVMYRESTAPGLAANRRQSAASPELEAPRAPEPAVHAEGARALDGARAARSIERVREQAPEPAPAAASVASKPSADGVSPREIVGSRDEREQSARMARADSERDETSPRATRRSQRRSAARNAEPRASAPEPKTDSADASSLAEREERTASKQASAKETRAPELELLRRARADLASRPREAFRMTEQHRREYPQGVFVQERDALAIEALLRVGELKQARARAETFVRDYPSSPHAHRFREALHIE